MARGLPKRPRRAPPPLRVIPKRATPLGAIPLGALPLGAVAALPLALLLLAPPALAEPTAPGTRYEVLPGDLPPPYDTGSASASPSVVERPADWLPLVPEGFVVTLFAGGLEHPRNLAVAPSGEVFLAQPRPGLIRRLLDGDGDGVAESSEILAEDFSLPHGLAVQGEWLYVADQEGVWRLPLQGGERERVTPAGAFGTPGGHWTRNLAFHPDGSRFYVAIGSAGNIAEEPLPRASVQVFAADGSGQETFASGLRNPVGIAFAPGGEQPYVVVNERDGLGDELVPDYLTAVQEDGFYGWPYAYIGPNPQPGFAERDPAKVAATLVPDLLFRSHSAPIGLAFYEGDSFPADYRGDAFVALRGSWNAGEPRGYMVVRVPFADGRPAGHYEAFVTGFRLDAPGGEGRAEVWGRPAGLAIAADGSLLIADDTSGSVWRVQAE